MASWSDLQVSLLRAFAQGLCRVGDAHVWLVFRKNLRQQLEPYRAKVPISVEIAEKSHAEALAALYHADQPDRAPAKAEIFRERLDAGSSCFVARVEGEIVAFNWLRVRAAIGAAEVPMVLQDDEIYTTNAYTADAWRGQGIHPALNYAMLKHAQERGYRTAFTIARADNARSLITMQRVGWSLSGTLLCFEPAWKPGELFWFARGSPYPMPVAGLASLRVPSLAEVLQQHRFDDRTLVKARPWSHTYRLRNRESTLYLKIVPRAHAAGLRTAATIAQACPANVPQVVACNHAVEAWLLTRDHHGSDLDGTSPPRQLLTMVETYAALQADAAKNPDLLKRLPAARIDDLVQSVLDFLVSDANGDGSAAAGAAYFLGKGAAQRFLEALHPRRELLELHVASAARLPVTLNHGNLRPSNAAITAAGHCVLISWTRAMSGPAGLSLHALVGGLLSTDVLLRMDRHVTDREATPLLSRYVSTLVRGGYANEEVLRACLPASITAGVLLDVLHLARYPMDDPDELRVVCGRLGARLEQLVDLGDRLQQTAAAGAGVV